ncbi:unnamed protein product [Caenorhabditis nigoni]
MSHEFLSQHPKESPQSLDNCANDTEIIIVKDRYNKHYIPSHPTQVRVDMWVQEVTSVSELTQDFEIEDPALVYEDMNPCKRNISFDDRVLQRLWIPNTCIINSKNAAIHESPFRNVFLMVFSNGTLWTNYRMKLTGPCDMKLKRFPFDKQKCYLTFESFNYNTGEVRMSWNQPYPVILLKRIDLPDFKLVNFSVIAVEQMYPAGWWDELTVVFVFQRRYGWYVLQGYIPTMVTIVISWISFYLGPRAIPARTMLGVNTLLAMTFQFGNIIRNLPRVVGFMSRNEGLPPKIKKRKRQEEDDEGFSWKSMQTSPHLEWRQAPMELEQPYQNISKRREKQKWFSGLRKKWRALKDLRPETVDFYSAIFFPTAYMLFNISYWSFYLTSLSEYFDEDVNLEQP